MYLNQLEIQKFRNLKPVRLTFSPSVNFIFGDNAQGKTNLVEAIYILCLAKSFRTREDAEIVPFSNGEFFIEGEFRVDDAIRRRIAVMYDSAQGKQISIDEKRLHRFSNLIGEFPIICLSAGDHEITSGSPVQRRRFFNILLSQSSRRYLDDLKQYEKIVRQRNTVLTAVMSGNYAAGAQLEIWDQQLVSFGSRLMRARREMVGELNIYLVQYYQFITRNRWSLRIDYHPNVVGSADDTVEAEFERQLCKWAVKEKKQGATLVGPHRDEFTFLVSDRELRLFGSRGEHKSALVSLKAAEAAVLQRRTDVPPIILLDDLFAELDSGRSASVLELFEKNRQIFITGADFNHTGLTKVGVSAENTATFFVDDGNISKGSHATHS
jgi:DNA replication and repair protein RecF